MNLRVFALVAVVISIPIFASAQGSGDGYNGEPYDNYPYGVWKADFKAQDFGGSTYDPTDEDDSITERGLSSELSHFEGDLVTHSDSSGYYPGFSVTGSPYKGLHDNNWNRIWMENVAVYPRVENIRITVDELDDELLLLSCGESDFTSWSRTNCWVEWGGESSLSTNEIEASDFFKYHNFDNEGKTVSWSIDLEDITPLNDDWKRWYDWRLIYAEWWGENYLRGFEVEESGGLPALHAITYGRYVDDLDAIVPNETGSYCADGIDNDGDWLGDGTTWYDPSSNQVDLGGPYPYTLPESRSGIPDFGERGVDCFDRSCDGSPGPAQAGGTPGNCNYQEETECQDGYDNDWDGLTDSDDPDCAPEEPESPENPQNTAGFNCALGDRNGTGAICGLPYLALPGMQETHEWRSFNSYLEGQWLFSVEESYILTTSESGKNWTSCADWAAEGNERLCADTGELRTTTPVETWYEDADGDGHGATMRQSDTWPGENWYVAEDLISTEDCYDENDDAKPGQSLVFSTDRGDGSFDYDCDGEETKYIEEVYSPNAAFSCSSSNRGGATCAGQGISGAGWVGSVPANCGESGTFKRQACGSPTATPACPTIVEEETRELRCK